jgi:uncharacterized membrane protein
MYNKHMTDQVPVISTARLEAFSDGVLAIVITIIMLELKVPSEATLAALRPVAPFLFAYLLSFCQIGTFWNNHHHLLRLTKTVTPKIMWRNLGFLFCISLTPFVTLWLGEHFGAAWPTAFFGLNALVCGGMYWFLQRAVISGNDEMTMAQAGLLQDRKGQLSLLLYALAVPLAFVSHWLSLTLYVAVAVMWFIPDHRVQQVLTPKK